MSIILEDVLRVIHGDEAVDRHIEALANDHEPHDERIAIVVDKVLHVCSDVIVAIGLEAVSGGAPVLTADETGEKPE